MPGMCLRYQGWKQSPPPDDSTGALWIDDTRLCSLYLLPMIEAESRMRLLFPRTSPATVLLPGVRRAGENEYGCDDSIVC